MPGPEIPSRKCGGCNMIHPPPWDANCPIAKGNVIAMDEKGQKIADFCTKLANFLHERKDFEKLINGIETFMKKLTGAG